MDTSTPRAHRRGRRLSMLAVTCSRENKAPLSPPVLKSSERLYDKLAPRDRAFMSEDESRKAGMAAMGQRFIDVQWSSVEHG